MAGTTILVGLIFKYKSAARKQFLIIRSAISSMILRTYRNQFDQDEKVKVNYDKFGNLSTESKVVKSRHLR